MLLSLVFNYFKWLLSSFKSVFGYVVFFRKNFHSGSAYNQHLQSKTHLKILEKKKISPTSAAGLISFQLLILISEPFVKLNPIPFQLNLPQLHYRYLFHSHLFFVIFNFYFD